MNRIKQSHLFNDEKIKFEINDTYIDIDKACKARLDLFNLRSTLNYNKILYLDTDILVKDDINKVFGVCKEDILYTLEEGSINDTADHWGRTLFGDEVSNYNDKTAFTTGILLFNNCEKIKDLFQKIKEDIIKRNHPFHDQPHIVYNAFKYNLYNNKLLKTLAVNNDSNIHSDKVVHHFPGGPGVYEHKIDAMTIFLNSIKDFTIENNISRTKQYINDNLMQIIHNTNELLEGNIFMLHHSTVYTDLFKNKSKNISNLVLNKNIKNVMEIGFNAGFSTLLMLLTNPNIHITCFDLGEHKYTIQCYEKIKKTFGERINIIIGDSTKTLQSVNDTYDVIHIDGGHTSEVAKSDIVNSYRLSKMGTILIMDDYDLPNLHELWDDFIIKYNLKNLSITVYDSPHHDIKCVSTSNISKILFQTDKTKPAEYVLNMIKNNIGPEWNYEFYNDDDVIQFFINNPLDDLSDLIQKYNSFKKGAHRADLFRYYYLYINGGFFMDSDAMLYVDINTIIKDYNFVSVNSSSHPGRIFQGILGASPKNKIIKKALYEAYNTDPNILDNEYHYFCRQLYDIIKQNDFGYNIKLYEERRIDHDKGDDILDGDTLLFKHYWKLKTIPKKEYLICFDTKYGKIFLNKRDKYFVDVFSKDQYWDDEQLCILRDKYIPNDKNILEIGGHSGTSTIFYSKILKENNIIYTFEPQKQMFDILNKNIEINNLNSKIKRFNSAIFCKTGQISMHSEDVDGPSKGNINILESENKEINYGGICLGNSGELTNCIKLDDLDFENIGYIHCDAQGAEPFIFSCATQFIKKHRPVILYEDMNLYGNYLFNIIKSSYPEFIDNSKFDIKNYCVKELGYSCISNFNNSEFDSLLLPYLHTDWNNYNKSEFHEFDYRVLNTYKIPNILVRVGPAEDGGYVIADGFEYDLFISCGISDDIRFEDAFLDIYKTKCIAFDGTIESFPNHRNNIEWVPKNIGYFNTEKTTNLKEYIQTNKKIFLKMDIEGSEFNWLDSMTETELDNFSQIVLEVHWPFDIYRMNMLKKLNKTHYIIHMHGNNYCDRDIPKHLPSGRTYDGTVTINNQKMPQIKLPEVFEVTYINKKLCDYSSVEMKEVNFPTILDYPNNPSAVDIYFSIPSYFSLDNKSYTWGNSYIKFLDNFKMDAFGEGNYIIVDTQNIIANFGGRIHKIRFNSDYTEFSSTRQDDLQIVNGKVVS
jgi:FkbM family methyltransferase